VPVSRTGPTGWQGPLRAAVAVFVVGFLFVWLVKPLGNPCPDLASLPQGSTASSSPSFSPPGSRTCTYAATAGIKATAKYVPWLDWIVLLLVAAAVGGAVRVLSPAGRSAKGERAARPQRPPRTEREPRAERQPHGAPAGDPPRAPEGDPPRAPAPAGERDAAERERARQERAARDRARRGR
jgi:hypothetical protein